MLKQIQSSGESHVSPRAKFVHIEHTRDKQNFITSFSHPDNCRHKSRKNRSNATTGCRSENDGRVSELHYHIDIGRPHTRFRGAEVLACQHHNIAIDWSDQLWHLKRFAEFSSHRNFHVRLILRVRAMLCVFSAIHDWIQGERRHQRIFQISPEDVKIETALYHGEQGSTKKEKGKKAPIWAGALNHIFFSPLRFVDQSFSNQWMLVGERDMSGGREIVYHKDCHSPFWIEFARARKKTNFHRFDADRSSRLWIILCNLQHLDAVDSFSNIFHSTELISLLSLPTVYFTIHISRRSENVRNICAWTRREWSNWAEGNLMQEAGAMGARQQIVEFHATCKWYQTRSLKQRL